MPKNEEKQTTVKSEEQLDHVKKEYFANFEKLIKNDENFSLLNQTFQSSKATYAGFSRRENKTYSIDFIEEIETAISALEAIVNDPQQFIKENPLVVEVEKAKRITHHSIKHMAQHTENIASVGSDGSVDPKKVLNMFIEDELKIYENRFIMTLVRRLQTFVELRHKYILEHSDTRNSDVVTMNSEVKIGEVVYTMETKLKVVVPSDDEGYREANQDILNRLLMLRKRILYLTTSRFMLEMRKAATVTDPVLQTNIMRLNYEYQTAYKLWMFISRYDSLGIEYKFKESKLDFTPQYMEKLNYHALSSYLTLESDNQQFPDKDVKLYYYKPRFASVELDKDMNDERIFAKGNPFKIINTKETEAQLEAKIRKQKEAEERKIKRAEERKRLKELKIKQKEEAKKKAEQKRLDAKKREEERKIRAQELKRLKDLEEAERMRIDKIKLDELRRLELARQEVTKVALKRKKSNKGL